MGALSVLLPALDARGERVSVWCGTSVGAVNAATCASLAHLPVPDGVERALGFWTEMRKGDVLAPIVGGGGLRTLARLIAHAAGFRDVGLAGFLDSSPLGASLERWIDFKQLARNVDKQIVDAVCIIATSLATGTPVGFVARKDGPPTHVDDAIRYVHARITGEHIRASAAIPLLFPTVYVESPRSARGHYLDGGVRLNSPIKPALNLGAERVIVIGLEPFGPNGGRPLASRTPAISDVISNILDGLLVDQVAADLRRLAAVNSFFVEDAIRGPRSSPRVYRLARGHQPYRPISYALVAPRRHGEIGRLAESVLNRRLRGLRSLRDLDYLLMSRALGARHGAHGDLLSFLLFDREYLDGLMRMGARDARRWLKRHPRFWCSDAGHDLAFAPVDNTRVREREAIEEFRATRHRREH
jgi:NTE family protein